MADKQIRLSGYDRATQLVIRQATALFLGSKVGGTAGPSISLLAGMGDIYYNIEQLAVEGKQFITTVDPNRPILRQLHYWEEESAADTSRKVFGERFSMAKNAYEAFGFTTNDIRCQDESRYSDARIIALINFWSRFGVRVLPDTVFQGFV